MRTTWGLAALALLALTTVGAGSGKPTKAAKGAGAPITPVVRSAEEWRQRLTPEQYRVLREQGTELAFTGKYWDEHARGIYRCAGCGLELFSSANKFDSGTGWPSFWTTVSKRNVLEKSDDMMGMMRVEVECARCGGHLGHVFDDGPRPTGLRYCINSAALTFVPAK